MINIVLMIHGNGNFICILSYSYKIISHLLVDFVCVGGMYLLSNYSPKGPLESGEIQVIEYAKLHLAI